ncbi:MAG: hypothetical protein DDG60_08755, partial [Anaerolineae bacterium]
GSLRYLTRQEILDDTGFLSGMSVTQVDAGLEKAFQRGTLLKVESSFGDLWMLNSPRGRATAEALRNAAEATLHRLPPPTPLPRPNIFQIYEENIGPLTPMMAETLIDAEREYSAEWLAEAIRIALERNIRNWKYIAAILRRWKEEGYEGKNRTNAEQVAKRYSQTKFDEYLD